MKEYDFHETCIRWILTEEMLPVKFGRYLVTVNLDGMLLVKFGFFYNGRFDIKNVIAWRQVPLPYPYHQNYFQ